MFKRFYPRTPDPYLGNNQDATIAKLGHINALIDYINDVPPGSGIQSVVAGTNVTVDDTDPLNPMINAIPTLQNVVDQGGLANNSTIREGIIDHGYGGGISRLCANNKDDQWEDGVRYLIETVGSTNTVVYAETINNVIPDDTYDETLSYAIGSRFKNLVTGIEYLCTQANEGNAIWVANSGVFYPITNAVLSANVVSVGGGSYGQYFVSGKSMILGVYFQQLDIDFDASTDASIIIDLPTDTGYSAASASGSASILFYSAPTAAATPVFSFCFYGGSGKVEIKLQNYGGEVSDIYEITATFVIELA